ncbi:hypothetical protein [uncultured Gimesia sp.]|uniref:hypothetical protein n=1 Tax=uncultured Gimesia sp. TaxID=1678688 RepID=UPI0030D811F5
MGRFDAICGYATIAVDFLGEELGQNPEPFDWLARYSKGHGITLHDVDYGSLTPRLGEMFILLVHAHFEEFLRIFLKIHVAASSWPDRGDASLFEYITKNLRLAHSVSAAKEREIIEYYRLARNIISHPGIKTVRANNQRTKLRSLLKITANNLPPNQLGSFDYGDFLMYTKAVKAYAAIICRANRPSDIELAALITPDIKALNRFKNNPPRFRNALRQYLHMNYNLNETESDPIIDHFLGR